MPETQKVNLGSVDVGRVQRWRAASEVFGHEPMSLAMFARIALDKLTEATLKEPTS